MKRAIVTVTLAVVGLMTAGSAFALATVEISSTGPWATTGAVPNTVKR